MMFQLVDFSLLEQVTDPIQHTIPVWKIKDSQTIKPNGTFEKVNPVESVLNW